MSDITLQRNVGSLLTVRRGGGSIAQTAGSTALNTGATINRASINTPLSAVFATLGEATLASGETVSVATTVQDSADGTTWAGYATETAVVVGTGPSGGGAVNFQHSFSVDLSSARQYVRAMTTPSLSRSGTDTCVMRSVVVFGGEDRLAAAA